MNVCASPWSRRSHRQRRPHALVIATTALAPAPAAHPPLPPPQGPPHRGGTCAATVPHDHHTSPTARSCLFGHSVHTSPDLRISRPQGPAQRTKVLNTA